MSSIVEIMTSVSRQLKAAIEASRENFSHNLSKGEAVEAAVRKFLRDHLPESIGVVHGQVIDRHGEMSTQLDVILYDAQRTPILFADQSSEIRIVPIEGVIAAIEVKTNLQLGDLDTIATSAKTLKGLDRTSYYRGDTIIQITKRAYGREWDVLPPMYFILAFDGPELTNAENRLSEVLKSTPLEFQIDTLCILNRGLVANSTPTGDGIDALPFPGSVRISCQTEHSLLFFYVLLTRYVLQGEVPPIAIQQYIPHDFKF